MNFRGESNRCVFYQGSNWVPREYVIVSVSTECDSWLIRKRDTHSCMILTKPENANIRLHFICQDYISFVTYKQDLIQNARLIQSI
jgi:hypothetical protein